MSSTACVCVCVCSVFDCMMTYRAWKDRWTPAIRSQTERSDDNFDVAVNQIGPPAAASLSPWNNNCDCKGRPNVYRPVEDSNAPCLTAQTTPTGSWGHWSFSLEPYRVSRWSRTTGTSIYLPTFLQSVVTAVTRPPNTLGPGPCQGCDEWKQISFFFFLSCSAETLQRTGRRDSDRKIKSQIKGKECMARI